jgi:hypothetical protein
MRSILSNEAAMLPQTQQALKNGGISMARSNKSRRFVQQGKDSVTKHAERIPYHMTYAEAEAYKMANHHNSSDGGM